MVFLYILFSGFLLIACSDENSATLEFEALHYPFATRNVTINDSLTIAYADEGEGDNVIVFVHGLGSYLPAWQKNISGLKDDFRCIALDLPGYGKSNKGPYPIDMAFYADVLAQFLKKLEIDKAVVAGHSMGAQIAITLALKMPEVVSHLVLIDPAGIETFTPDEKAWLKKVVTAQAVKLTPPQRIRANITANFYDMPKDAEFMVVDRLRLRGAKDFDKYCLAVEQSVAGMVDEPVFEHLGEIVPPTLVIFGENDNLIPNPYLHGGKSEDIGKIAKEKIPNCQLEIIPKCGHFTQFEKPEVVNRLISTFIK